MRTYFQDKKIDFFLLVSYILVEQNDYQEGINLANIQF